MFSGILPGGSEGDYALLQDLRGNPIEWDKIVAEPGYIELIEDIRKINGI